MRKLLAAFTIALVLGGCALLSPTKPLGTTTVDLQKGAYTAKLGFNTALIVAVAYIETPRCGRPTSPTICSQQDVVDILRDSIITADKGTQAAEKAAKSLNVDSTALGLAITAAEAAVTALQAITPKR